MKAQTFLVLLIKEAVRTLLH